MTDNKTPIDQETEAMADGPPSPAPRPSRINMAIAGLIGLAAVGGIGWWAFRPHHDLQAQQTATPAPSVPKAAPTDDPPKPQAAPPASPTTDSTPPRPPESAQATPPATAPAGTPTTPPAAAPPSAPPPAPESKPEASKTPAAPPSPAPVGAPPLPPRKGAITEEALDLVKRRAAAGETDAMEELARRYVEGAGVKANAAEGAQWLQRAAERGAPSAMYNVGVMYERGIVLGQDPAKALEWYAKASAAGVPMAMHNMALMYREGSGVPTDYKRANDLLLAAARNGMSASMYALGTMYEAGTHGLAEDLVQAVVWYAMALQFQRANPATQHSDLAQRAEVKMTGLQLVLPTDDLRRAQTMGETEFRLIVDTVRNGPKAPPAAVMAPPTSQPGAPAQPPAGSQTADTSSPKGPAAASTPTTNPVNPKEQLTEIQKMLSTLRIYGGKADGAMGPATRNAIKTFQRTAGMPESGEPSQALVDALREKIEAAKKN